MPTAPAAVPTTPLPADTPAPKNSGGLTSPGSPSKAVGYFQRRWPAALILAAFPAIALPMAAVGLLYPANWLVWGYIWVFGMTHFVVTLAVYTRGANLRHFAASTRNRVVFFLVPVAMLVGFDLYHALRVGVALPLVGLLVLLAVRLADFNHFNRQSFGVLQLFKARTGVKFPAGLKRAENLYFCSLSALLFVTFLAGGVCPLIQPGGPLTVLPVTGEFMPSRVSLPVTQTVFVVLLAVTAGLFGWVAAGLWREGRKARGFASAAAYLLAQTGSAALAVSYFPLYFAALAVHYVEYHVLMAPRCLRPSAEATNRIDRAFAGLRARPVRFYVVVLAAAAVVTLAAGTGMGMMGLLPSEANEPFGYLALIAAFDGLFVAHYFVEMFIWRFSDPHFRRELSGLYFAPSKP